MSQKWLYFPFNDISQDTTMPQNRKRYEEKYQTRLTVAFKGDSLSGVKDDDMLIIAGHGLPNSDKIGVTTNPGTKILGVTVVAPTQATMTANDLADEIATARLPDSHRYIKLITCGGGGMAAVDDKNATITNNKVTAIPVTTHSHATDCLASVLAKALGQRGYNSVMVKGYPGFVNGQGAQKTVSVEGTSDTSQKKKLYQELFHTGGVALGSDYWKDGTVGMVTIPSNLVNDYWFDKNGNLQKQHISLKTI